MPNPNIKTPVARKSKSAEPNRTPNAQPRPQSSTGSSTRPLPPLSPLTLPPTPPQHLNHHCDNSTPPLAAGGSYSASPSDCESAGQRQCNASRSSLQVTTNDQQNAYYFDVSASSGNEGATAVYLQQQHQQNNPYNMNNNNGNLIATSVSAMALAMALPQQHNLNIIDADLIGSVSPQEHELCLNLASTCSLGGSSGTGWDANNHRIYSIDELSEVSGRSDAVLAHERMQMERVQQILNLQELQAQKGRPVSRRGYAQQSAGQQQQQSSRDSKSVNIK